MRVELDPPSTFARLTVSVADAAATADAIRGSASIERAAAR